MDRRSETERCPGDHADQSWRHHPALGRDRSPQPGESTDGVSEQDSQVQPQNAMAYIRQRPMLCCASTAATSYKTVQWRTRPMKMGTIISPWRYDAAMRHALRLAKLRRPSIQHCAP